MKVFMSWSGARSKAAAELLHDWVKCVIQAAKPWISTRGIGRGAVWFAEINSELKDTSVGIICLTHQNKSSPWILFEAGALAKGLTTNRVCTFLVDLGTNDIQDPLAQFNHTLPTKDGLWNLVLTLNSSLDNMLDGATILAVFETFWPEFERKFAALLQEYPQEAVVEVREEKDLLEEILQTTRSLDKRLRTVETIGELTGNFESPAQTVGALTTLANAEQLVRNMRATDTPPDEMALQLKRFGVHSDVILHVLGKKNWRLISEKGNAASHPPATAI
jgi:hypothetical protein